MRLQGDVPENQGIDLAAANASVGLSAFFILTSTARALGHVGSDDPL